MNIKMPSSEQWRQANKPVKTVLGLNPSLLAIYLLALFGMKYALWLSLIIATVLTVFFGVVEYRGVKSLMALRWVRVRLIGRKKRVWPSWVNR